MASLTNSVDDHDADAATLTQDVPPSLPVQDGSPGKSRAFYLSFMAIMVATFLSVLDLATIGTALPTISTALNDTKGDYTWVGSALADAFGRRPIMLICIGFFALGSALAGASQNMSMMIAARADLVPLNERGLYQGLLGFVWSFASSIGPPIGGALANKGHKAWRWLFFLNLPLTGIAFILVSGFLSVRHPEGSLRSKLAQVDWVGNAIVIVGSGLAIIGMTWGGIRYPWSSAEVLAPLIIGLALLVVFAIYEAKVPQKPTVPRDIVSNRTSLSALLTTAAHGMVSIAMIYYLPVFFQACFGASPIRSAVDFLPGALITAPFALVAGVIVTIVQKYRAVNFFGWIFAIIGFGLFSTLKEDSSVGKWVGYQVVTAIGTGILFAAPVFPLLAPLPTSRSASALALFAFTRSFFQTWGITISSTILQNMLEKKLPADFVSQFPAGFEIAYAAIPAIKHLEEPLKKQVQAAFASSMSVIWKTMIGISGLGLLLSFLMAELPMGNTVDENYGLQEKERVLDAEKR
ncbi:MFS domain-containing protein [Mycena venus]|uniref:MFS domain-containing protein n=1 Tax=Mycena venus TaxID=2733690 RepID=A0A8H6WY32_9AGAR|nr:MFS domain-containing protein [Mycena venus]